MPKNASKNCIFASFFAKNGQNLHFFTQKTGKKTTKTTLFTNVGTAKNAKLVHFYNCK